MNKKILIIEDEKGISDLVKFRLEGQGYIVEQVFEGSSALERIKAFKPDLMLLDIMLPGKDGRDILSEVKKDENLRMIPVIITSGKDGQFDRVQGLELGAIDYVVKPFSLVHLSNKIKELLDNNSKDK